MSGQPLESVDVADGLVVESDRKASVDVLLPTIDRLDSLVFTLAGLAGQTGIEGRRVRLVVADQSLHPVCDNRVVQTLLRLLDLRLGPVEYQHRPQVHGIAEQRHFLLSRSQADFVLYLDDDVYMEPWVLERMCAALEQEGCGFIGAFPAGLSHKDDIRPEQESIEFWNTPVRSEAMEPEGPDWGRWHLHRAANLLHVAERLPRISTGDGTPGVRLYKVAWVASCVLYDRRRLNEVGGFSFWPRLPRWHSGEEVLVQNLLMRRWGGCGIIPSGTYYSQVESTTLNERGTVDGHALTLLPEMLSAGSLHPTVVSYWPPSGGDR